MTSLLCICSTPELSHSTFGKATQHFLDRTNCIDASLNTNTTTMNLCLSIQKKIKLQSWCKPDIVWASGESCPTLYEKGTHLEMSPNISLETAPELKTQRSLSMMPN